MHYWIRNLVARFVARHPRIPADAAATRQTEQENDIFAELIAASSFLDFGGMPAESKLKDIDLDRGLRPW